MRAAEAAGSDELRTRWAHTRVAKEKAFMAAVSTQRAAAHLATRVGKDPWIGRWILKLAAKTAIGSRNHVSGIKETAFGAMPV